MGLPCAPQMANLACYVPEREFACRCKPEDVQFNYRFIDDILTMSGKIPSEEEYGMKYKETRRTKRELEYLGMKLRWTRLQNMKWRFETGVYFRDEQYPSKYDGIHMNHQRFQEASR